jgi:hypothetical protein
MRIQIQLKSQSMNPKSNPIALQIWLAAILFKVLVSVFYIYYHKDQGDLWFYHSCWQQLYAQKRWFYAPLAELSNQPRAAFFVGLAYPIYILSGANLFLMGLVMSGMAFFGAFWAFIQLYAVFPKAKWALFFGFFIWPVSVFWPSGPSKETFVAFIFYPLVALSVRKKLQNWEWIGVLAGFVVLFFLKYYYAVFLATLWLAVLIKDYFELNWVKSLACMLLLAWLLGFLHPNLQAKKLAKALRLNSQKIAEQTVHSSHLIQYFYSKEEGFRYWLDSPWVWFQATFGPFWGQSMSMKALSVFSYLQLFLFGTAMLNFRAFDKDWLVFFVIFCAGMVLFLGFSTPNYGTLSRYKIASEPFWIAGLVHYSFFCKRE